MSDTVYDKPVTSIDPFARMDKEVIHDRNDLVVQQFLEKQAKRKQGIRDEADFLVEQRLQADHQFGAFPVIEIDGEEYETRG